MYIETTSCLRDEATGNYHLTLTAHVDSAAIERAVQRITGEDGLGDPQDSKGLQMMVFPGGGFTFCSFEETKRFPDAIVIPVSTVRAGIRQALN